MPLSGARRTVHKVNDRREYKKIGRLNATIANAIGVEAGDIVLDANAITHIVNEHPKELAQLGLTAEAYATGIVRQFNAIYKGKDGRLLLVINKEQGASPTAVVSLIFSKVVKMWEVVTAQPRGKQFFKNKAMLWQKKK